jgi:DNA-binding transcriptional LysR family regulator
VSVRVPGLIVSDDSGTLTVAGVNGAGIMAASEWSVGQELASGQLVRVLPEWLYDWTSAVHVVMPPGRFIPAKTRAFIDRLVTEFAPDPPWRRISERGH